MRWRSTVGAATLASVLCWGSLLSQAPDSQEFVRSYLARNNFSADEIAELEAGRVITRVDADRSTGSEIFVVAAVKILVPRANVTAYYGQMVSYVDGEVTTGFGRFSAPPAIADVKDLAFDREEVEDLKSCRPGKCDIRLGGASLDALRSSIDWSAPDYPERVNAFARKAALDYVAGYQARGDAALVTYNDRAKPVSLQEQWLGILANSPLLQEYTPELKTYLERFPKANLPGAQDVFYWVKGRYGLAPIIGIVHGVLYEPPNRDRTMVVQKQLYASHYLDASLAVATLLDARQEGHPATYMLYTNRSRGDLLKGGFGGLKREVGRSQARRAAEETLGTIKQMLEAAQKL